MRYNFLELVRSTYVIQYIRRFKCKPKYRLINYLLQICLFTAVVFYTVSQKTSSTFSTVT